MKTQSSQAQPMLQKPGAGLPFIQMLALRYYYGPFVAKRSNWNKNTEGFIRINQKILALVEDLPKEKLETKILVPKLPAIEDSSRFWSIHMTLEHLMIVGNKIKAGVIGLSHGVKGNEKADTAKVKPKGEQDAPSILEQFRIYTNETQKEIASKIGDKDNKTTFKHPWFGEFNTRQWHWLLTMHSLTHLNQIKEILKQL